MSLRWRVRRSATRTAERMHPSSMPLSAAGDRASWARRSERQALPLPAAVRSAGFVRLVQQPRPLLAATRSAASEQAGRGAPPSVLSARLRVGRGGALALGWRAAAGCLPLPAAAALRRGRFRLRGGFCRRFLKGDVDPVRLGWGRARGLGHPHHPGEVQRQRQRGKQQDRPGTTHERRARNPDAGSAGASGFGARGFCPRPGMTRTGDTDLPPRTG